MSLLDRSVAAVDNLNRQDEIEVFLLNFHTDYAVDIAERAFLFVMTGRYSDEAIKKYLDSIDRSLPKIRADAWAENGYVNEGLGEAVDWAVSRAYVARLEELAVSSERGGRA